MERNVMGELNVYRESGARPNFSEIARRHGMDRHTVAKYWREGEAAVDGRSARGSAFDPLEEEIRAKAQLPGMTEMADLCQDFGHGSSRNQAAIGMASGLGSVLSKKAAMASAGTL